MRTLIAIAALFACASVGAYEVPSSVAGWYATPTGVVRLVPYRAGSQVLMDVTYVSDAGMPSFYLQSVYAPDACPTDSLAIPLSPGVWFAVKSAGPSSIDVNVGAQFAAGAGIGMPQTWTLLRPLPSPSPYTCATAQPRIDPHALARFCRQNPTVPACRG
jgi:hypothetical protein